MVISDEVELIIWVDDKIALVVGKQALWGSGDCLLWQMCGRDAAWWAVIPEQHRGWQWCCWGAEGGWRAWHSSLGVRRWGPRRVKVWPRQQFGMRSWGKQGKSSGVYGALTLSVSDRDPGALCGGCGCEHCVWSTVHEGDKQQLEQGTCGRAMGHWLRCWQRIEAEFKVVWGSWYGIFTLGGVNCGSEVVLMAERC